MILHLGLPLARFVAVEPCASALTLALDINTHVGNNSRTDALQPLVAIVPPYMGLFQCVS